MNAEPRMGEAAFSPSTLNSQLSTFRYFDFNATTPLHPAAVAAWLEAAGKFWHNASGLYREGAAVRRALDEARERLGERLGVEPERVVFTSGATESNNALMRMLVEKNGGRGGVLSSGLEHPSVREPLAVAFAGRVKVIPTLRNGQPDVADFERSLEQGEWVMATVMAANNECGVLLPWETMAERCRARGVVFHCDAAQWIGKMPADGLGACDYVTGSAHKFGGPKGVGFLVMRDEEESLGFLRGGPQEEGRRAGTENYPAVAGMMAALDAVEEAADRDAGWRDEFEEKLTAMLPGSRIIGGESPRLWNTSMLVLPRHDHRKWLARLSDRGFAISTGSACSAGRDGSSVVLGALGASWEEMRRVVRVSSGWITTREDWLALAEAFGAVAGELDGGAARNA